jgi:hypothetical protein
MTARTSCQLPKDQIVELEIRAEPEEPLRKGSPAAVLQVMRSSPKVSMEAMEEFRRALEEGELPVRDEPVFRDERDKERSICLIRTR